MTRQHMNNAESRAWTERIGLRPWEEVAEEYNRRHPDEPPMSRSNVQTIAKKAEQKLREALADEQ